MKKQIILVGGGGHCKSCIDVIETEGKFSIKGILDLPEKVGNTILGYPIIGDDSKFDELIHQGYSFFITIGQIKSSIPRYKIFKTLKSKGANFASVISPCAYVSNNSSIGQGTIVMHGVKVNVASTIGENVILNTNCLIEHDSVVGNHTHISTGSILNGNVQIGSHCFIGSGSIVSQGASTVDKVIIGAGSVVLKSISSQGIYAGIPAQTIKDEASINNRRSRRKP